MRRPGESHRGAGRKKNPEKVPQNVWEALLRGPLFERFGAESPNSGPPGRSFVFAPTPRDLSLGRYASV